MEKQTKDEYRAVFLHSVSRALSDYWLHRTKGHDPPRVSAEDYLGLLVERVLRGEPAR